MTLKTRIAGAVGALVVGATLLSGCYTITPVVSGPTETPTPTQKVTPTPTATEDDFVFNTAFEQAFGYSPTQEIRDTAHAYADEASTRYSNGESLDSISADIYVIQDGTDLTLEEAATLWAISIGAYGSDELFAAAQVWADGGSDA